MLCKHVTFASGIMTTGLRFEVSDFGCEMMAEEFETLRPAFQPSLKASPRSSQSALLLPAEHGARTSGRGWRSPQPKATSVAPCDTYKTAGSYLRELLASPPLQQVS